MYPVFIVVNVLIFIKVLLVYCTVNAAFLRGVRGVRMRQRFKDLKNVGGSAKNISLHIFVCTLIY